MEAVADGDEEEIKTLLKAGAQIDAEDDEGLTAFHRTLLGDDPEMAQLLLYLGADINQTNCISKLHVYATHAFVQPMVFSPRLPLLSYFERAMAYYTKN